MRPAPSAVGVVLAAGAGSRMGSPKALLRGPQGTPRTVHAAVELLDAGCAPILVVLGAAAAEAEHLLSMALPAGLPVRTVHNPDWADGMASSLRTALFELTGTTAASGHLADPDAVSVAGPAAVLVTLVDLPDVGAAVMGRVLERWSAGGARSDALVRATYAGQPGHPVLLGRAHWPALVAELSGDSGAQSYLRRHRVTEVECDDLASGRDVDRPQDLHGWDDVHRDAHRDDLHRDRA